ncbi:isoprenylcysteine carboxylmethyltransferase family protein [Hyphococcus flavus]|uniref:Isoprenylcysteine carboxylmethyltransferase family protein n=1 Tax=Hyphococcus flavus TaxID=1866326 RepID=A0AAF0CG14_9PROT|nr:isoprenylcysteine carboxylmethyltransferase family protein [Hyphococcus flavus]WDI31678.1 isoprenylcysteine carboxylmethyltransferase family protein [Hyphococcus flavus]
MDQEQLRYSVAFIVILLMAWMIGFGVMLRLRGVETAAIAEGRGNVRQRLLIAGAAILDMYLVLRAPFSYLDQLVLARSAPQPLLSLFILVLGGLIILISQSGMGHSWRVGVPDKKNHVDELVVTGMHRISRNPVYLGIMIFLIGAMTAAPGPFTLFAVFISYIGLTMIISQEERYLEERFGDQYRDYKNRVRRWI